MTDADGEKREDLVIRVVVVITLGVVLVAAIIGLTVTAVMTERDLARPETFTFAGTILLAAMGGVSWWTLRRSGK